MNKFMQLSFLKFSIFKGILHGNGVQILPVDFLPKSRPIPLATPWPTPSQPVANQ
jgi:hypothetical protein